MFAVRIAQVSRRRVVKDRVDFLVMPEMRPSGRFLSSASLGFFFGLVAKELDFGTLVSFHEDRALVVAAAAAIGGLLGLARFEKLVAGATTAAVALWLLVAFTPLTHWMGEGLVRRDSVEKADAVFVLASSLQSDGDLSTAAMSRLLGGLDLLGRGLAPRLILSELPPPSRRYRDAASKLMSSLGLNHEILEVGPVSNTHDEAVAVGALARERGFERVLVVTSPGHSLRASLALETEGVKVISAPSMETQFDYEALRSGLRGDDRVRAFGPLIHERVGLLYYRYKGWIR
jgi:uncharacterized SAM-binding protein YcdF (DUF218 family)